MRAAVFVVLAGCGGPPPGWTECYRIPAHFAEDPVLWVPSALAEEIGAGTDELPYIACDTYVQCDQGASYRGELYGYGRSFHLDPDGTSGTHDAEGQRLRCNACNYANGAAFEFYPSDAYWPEDPAETCGWDAESPSDPSGYTTWTDDPRGAL